MTLCCVSVNVRRASRFLSADSATSTADCKRFFAATSVSARSPATRSSSARTRRASAIRFARNSVSVWLRARSSSRRCLSRFSPSTSARNVATSAASCLDTSRCSSRFKLSDACRLTKSSRVACAPSSERSASLIAADNLAALPSSTLI